MSGNDPLAGAQVILIDTNVIIEAVRTGCWNALTGTGNVETVEECRDESLRGDATRRGYIPVSQTDLNRLAKVHPVSEVERATFALTYSDAGSMDDGERDLFAHALGRAQNGDERWLFTSPDKASVRAAVKMGWGDRLCSLGGLIRRIGSNPRNPLAEHHGEKWLQAQRTHFTLIG